MSLASQLLKISDRLRQCALIDAKHVTLNDRGPHVALIHQALGQMRVAGQRLAVDAAEVRASHYGPSTAATVHRFKSDRRILGPGQATPDRIVGKLTILRLDLEMLALEGGGGGTWKDDTIPAGWKGRVNDAVLTKLQESYRAATQENGLLKRGFHLKTNQDLSFGEVLDLLEADDEQKGVSLLDELYGHISRFAPAIWPLMESIVSGWRAGDRSSWGYLFNSFKGQEIENILRASPSFCSDLMPGERMHQEKEFAPPPQTRKCYRALSGVGVKGLHICIVRTNRDKFGGLHNIHFDPHQVASEKTPRCSCWYKGLKTHFEDVGPWIIQSMVMPFLAKALKEKLGHTLTDFETQLLQRLLTEVLVGTSDIYDTLVKWSEDPSTFPTRWYLPEILRRKIMEVLPGYKAFYFALL